MNRNLPAGIVSSRNALKPSPRPNTRSISIEADSPENVVVEDGDFHAKSTSTPVICYNLSEEMLRV